MILSKLYILHLLPFQLFPTVYIIDKYIRRFEIQSLFHRCLRRQYHNSKLEILPIQHRAICNQLAGYLYHTVDNEN